MVLALALLGACSSSVDGLDRLDFVDDPVFGIEVTGAEPQPILSGPMGGPTTNDRGYHAERRWSGVSSAGFEELLSDLVDAGVTFHRVRCRDRGPVLTGTKSLASGLVTSVKVQHLPDDVATVGVTGLDPERRSGGPLTPPGTIDVSGDCNDPGLLATAGLVAE